MRAAGGTPSPAELVRLTALAARTVGRPDVRVGLIDGPVATGHPDLASATILGVGDRPASCDWLGTTACGHGTFVAGILVGRRGSDAPSLCPGCTLLVRPIFGEEHDADGVPVSGPAEVSRAVVECVEAGAAVINLSAAVGHPTVRVETEIRAALDYAAERGTVVVAATGNQSTLGSSEITRHPAVLPVVAYDRRGRLLATSNIGMRVGRSGLGGPGEVTVFGTSRAGTSVATAFVAGAAALLMSLFADRSAREVRHALLCGPPRRSVVPPLLDAEAAYRILAGRRPSQLVSTGSRRWGAARL